MTEQAREAVTKLTRNILIPREQIDQAWVDVWPAAVEAVIKEFKGYASEHGMDIGSWDLKIETGWRWNVTDCSDERVIYTRLVEEDAARAYVFGHAAGIGPLPRPDMLHAHFTTVEHHRG